MMDLSIIIVSYNTKRLLKECIDSVISASIKPFNLEIIIVDNASTDGSIEILSNKYKVLGIKLIENKENMGFSKANNLGVKEAKGRYLLFLNPDTVVNKNTLFEMIKFMDKNKNVGVATCKVLLPDGKIDDACHRGFPTPWNSFYHFTGLSKLFPHSKMFSGYSLGYLDLNKNHEIDACAGAFMMVRREAGEEINWWDEDYFWYGEDLDFCYRLKNKGWLIYYFPQVTILHYKGVSGGLKESSRHLTIADEKIKKMATKARFDAMKIFYKKHYVNKYPFFINWFTMQGVNIKKFLSSLSICL